MNQGVQAPQTATLPTMGVEMSPDTADTSPGAGKSSSGTTLTPTSIAKLFR
jgi:hypothetical protein